MKSKYEVVDFRLIEKKNLRKHPAAELPMMDDDKAALKGSIEERGIIQPLLVLAESDAAGFFRVIDGCNRLESSAEDAVLPCMLVKTDDPRAVALECLATGRRRSTGQRIMVFLMMHKKEVLKAAELGAKIGAGGWNKGSGVSHETPQISGVFADFTPEAIAERLQVSREDVVRAVELFRCAELGLHPSIGRDNERPLDIESDGDMVAAESNKRVFNAVLSGGTAVRKWRAAWAGRKSTTGPQGRPEVKYDNLVERGLKMMRTVFSKDGAWEGLRGVDRDPIADLFEEVMGMLPAELRLRMPKGESKKG